MSLSGIMTKSLLSANSSMQTARVQHSVTPSTVSAESIGAKLDIKA